MDIYEVSDLKEILDKHSEGVDDLNSVKWSKEAISEITRATKSVLSAATIVLQNSQPFVGTFKSRVRTNVSFDLKAPMAINVTSSGLSSTQNLYVNPAWLVYQCGDKSEGVLFVNYQDVSAVILHEMFHLLYNHYEQYSHTFSKQGYHREVNIGTDTQINQNPIIAKNKHLTDYGITLESTAKMVGNPNLAANESSLYYIKTLIAAKQKQQCPQCQQQQQGQGSNGQSQGSGQGGQQDSGQGQGQNQGQQQDSQQGSQQGNQQDSQQGNQQGSQQGNQQGNQKGQHSPGCPNGDAMGADASHEVWSKTPSDCQADNPDESVATPEVAARSIVDAVKSAMAQDSKFTPEYLKERGLVAGGILDEIMTGKVTKGKLPIKSVIQRGGSRLKWGERKTFSRIHKHQANNIRIKRGKKVVNNRNIHCYVDTSGSMSRGEIEWALKEIAAVSKQLKTNLSVLPFDFCVYKDNPMKTDKNGSYQVSIVGRGGTAFQPVFDHLQELSANNLNDLAIILTDGGGETTVDFHGFRNVIWILIEEGTNVLSVRNPVGNVAWLDQDDKYVLHKLENR